jgi:hypothetical protein
VRRPKALNICGHKVRIGALNEQAESDVCGLCFARDNAILIREDMADDNWYEILLHEILHYIETCQGVKVSHQAIYAISNALAAMGWRPGRGT